MNSEGSKLFSAQLVKLPVKCLDYKQNGINDKCGDKELKSLPPRFSKNKENEPRLHQVSLT